MAPPRDYVLPFAALRATDIPRVGGKGANLGELVAAGLPVPDGFCVTTAAYDDFLASCPDAPPRMLVIDGCKADDLPAIRRTGAVLRALIKATPIPETIIAAIRDRFAALDPDGTQAFAVRSSATLEDLPEASFAGQQDTFLNVRGADELLERVRECWASLFTNRAISYRRQRGYGSSAAKLAVVIQRMVASERSGILFTADPISGHRGVMSIDASYGLGEALVSGIVDADNYQIRRSDGHLLALRLGAKAVEIVPNTGEGENTELRSVPQERRAQRALDDGQLGQLVEIAERVEAHYGSPQDLEWCFEGGAPYLVQARPITTLFPVPTGPEDRGLHVYISFNHIQVMTDPILPLGMDSMRWTFPIGKRHDHERCSIIRQAGGRLFFDVTPAMLRSFTRARLPRLLPLIDPKMASMLLEVIGREGFLQADDRPRARLGLFARTRAIPAVRRLIPILLWRDPARARERADAIIQAHPERWARELAPKHDKAAWLTQASRTLCSILPAVITDLAPTIMAGLIAWRLLRRLTGDDPRVHELSRGLDGNVTTQMDLELGDIADAARAHPRVLARLRQDIRALTYAPDSGKPDPLEGFKGADDVRGAWREFLARYGHRGIGEIDLSRPRWAQDPSSLLRSLDGMLHDATIGGHRAQHQAAAAAAAAAAQGLIAEAKGLKRWRIRRLIPRMRAGLAMREHPKFMAMRGFYEVRCGLAKLGEELAAAGMLATPDDIWWLDYDEIARALEGESFGPIIATRRADYLRYQGLRVPRVITSEGEIPRPPRNTELPEGTLEGFSASTGITEGLARVILDPSTEVMRAGEILIAPFTDPGWTPLFVHAEALVMEVGGLMTHGSVVAREYGIPAVVGVDDATTLIKTGQRIRVDGDAGLVTILAEAEPEAGDAPPAQEPPEASTPGAP